ncbi:MAG: hypothetical protein HY082_00025 [Gammaproteobacteria bacterium]|nr:hypothetical protein [Gammaproteobacteria bacterium]MBI5783290.1 hypothetical protein [Gammaproteobacteria bacterium]
MKKILFAITLMFVTLGYGGAGRAQEVLLDDVETSVESEWAVIRVHFTMPVNYERHFPQEHGQLLKIFFTITGLDMQNVSLRTETRHVSATPVLPATTITFEPPLSLNLQRDPWSLSVRFNRDVNYNVRPGDDNRSIVIYLPIVPAETSPAHVPKDIPAEKETPTK